MRKIEKEFLALSIFNKYDKISNSNIFVAGGVGSGKTCACESICEQYHNNGFLVIIVTEKPRAEFDYGFMAFEPVSQYHVEKLKIEGKSKSKKKIKLYHPYTKNFLNYVKEMPMYKKLPPIEWYKYPVSKCNENDFSFLLETNTKNDSVQMLLRATKKLKSHQGVNDLIYSIQKEYRNENKKKTDDSYIKPDFDNFGVSNGHSGTTKDIKSIATLFSIFKDDNFLTDKNDENLLDIKKILQDKEHVHIFQRKFLAGKKAKYYDFMRLTREILNNIEYATSPILLVFEEVKVWFPEKPRDTYINIAGEFVRDDLATIRNAGQYGCTTLANTQNIFDVHPSIRDSATEEYWGFLPTLEIDRLAKSLGLNTYTRNRLTKLKAGHFIKKGDFEVKEWTFLMPGHAHADEGLDFLKMWKKNYPDLVFNYSDFFKQQEDIEKEKFNKFKATVQEDYRKEKERLAKSKEKKKSVPASEKVSIIKDKIKEKNKANKEEKMKMCYSLYFGECEQNALAVVKKLDEIGISISNKTVKAYAETYKQKKEQEEALPDVDHTYMPKA